MFHLISYFASYLHLRAPRDGRTRRARRGGRGAAGANLGLGLFSSQLLTRILVANRLNTVIAFVLAFEVYVNDNQL